MTNMTLGEAMIMGQTILGQTTNGDWLRSYSDSEGHKQYCGCALGGALLAVGLGEEYCRTGDLLPLARTVWPWIQHDHVDTITHLYASVLRKDRTIEEMAATVDSWAPVLASPETAPNIPQPSQPEPKDPEPAPAAARVGRIADLIGHIWA